MTSFFRRCSTNLTFLTLQCPIFNQMSTHGRQTLKLHQIETKNLWLDQKTFQKILPSSFRVTSFFRRCPANLTFLALQCPIFNQMSTHGSQTSQITPNWNKKPRTRCKDLSESFILKLLCDVIFLSLSGQFGIPSFTMFNFQSDEYPWKPNFSN